MDPLVDIDWHQRMRQRDRLGRTACETESMGTIGLPERFPGSCRSGLVEQRFETTQRDQGVAAQGGVGLAVDGEGVLEAAEHLHRDRETPMAAEPGPQRRSAPVSTG